jgi:hypothetical protein
MDKASVKNASDPEQIKNAEKLEEYEARIHKDSLKAVLSTKAGRRYLWTLLGRCRVFESVMHTSGSQTAYLAGRQDVGHEILAEITEYFEERYFEMMREAQAEAKTRNEKIKGDEDNG